MVLLPGGNGTTRRSQHLRGNTNGLGIGRRGTAASGSSMPTSTTTMGAGSVRWDRLAEIVDLNFIIQCYIQLFHIDSAINWGFSLDGCIQIGDCLKLQRKGHLDLPSSKPSGQRWVFQVVMLRILTFQKISIYHCRWWPFPSIKHMMKALWKSQVLLSTDGLQCKILSASFIIFIGTGLNNGGGNI